MRVVWDESAAVTASLCKLCRGILGDADVVCHMVSGESQVGVVRWLGAQSRLQERSRDQDRICGASTFFFCGKNAFC